MESENNNSSGKRLNWIWSSALIGAAAATAAIMARPKDPTFHLISIDFTNLKLNLPVLDAEVILNVHVTNPNIVPIQYTPTTMSIYYDGALLGKAKVHAGSQKSRSCETLKLEARLDVLELAQHVGKFIADVKRREMVLDSEVDIEGKAKVFWWNRGFKVRVDGHIVVDPVFLDIIDQQTKADLQFY